MTFMKWKQIPSTRIKNQNKKKKQKQKMYKKVCIKIYMFKNDDYANIP